MHTESIADHLKSRHMRQLSVEDIKHYQTVVVALKETIRLMGEVDVVIESAGGGRLSDPLGC